MNIFKMIAEGFRELRREIREAHNVDLTQDTIDESEEIDTASETSITQQIKLTGSRAQFQKREDD